MLRAPDTANSERGYEINGVIGKFEYLSKTNVVFARTYDWFQGCENGTFRNYEGSQIDGIIKEWRYSLALTMQLSI